MVSTNINARGELEIYLDNCLLATITDGEDTEEFIEDILYGMGYIWNKDGTVSKFWTENLLWNTN